jgi:hypothetical protein
MQAQYRREITLGVSIGVTVVLCAVVWLLVARGMDDVLRLLRSMGDKGAAQIRGDASNRKCGMRVCGEGALRRLVGRPVQRAQHDTVVRGANGALAAGGV